MNDNSIRRNANLYLIGLAISAFGSLATASTMPALLLRFGVSTAFIGTLIGSLRINAFLVNLFFGHVGDRFSPLRVIIVCELGAAVGSLLIWICWYHFGTENLIAFLLANNIRAFFTALQSGSAQKYGKLFDQRLNWSGKMALRMNGATNGMLLVAGLLSVYFFSHLTLDIVILVDFLSFVVNGGLLYFLQTPLQGQSSSMSSRARPEPNISFYYRLFPRLFLLDAALSLALCGANTLNLRLLESSPNLIPLMPAIFGGAALATSFFTFKRMKPESPWLWWLLGITLIAQGMAIPYPILVLGLSGVRNVCYWLIYQSISREFMRLTPSDSYSAAAAGRSSINIAVLASGEFWVGFTQQIGVIYEMGWRAFVAFLGPLISRRKENNETH